MKPIWLQKEFAKLEEKKQKFKAIPEEPDSLVSQDEFNRLLSESGMSVREVAEQVGVSRQFIYKIKNGKKRISQRLSGKIRELIVGDNE